MEKTKLWRRISMALLSVAFSVTMSLALIEIFPARAEGGVLAGNTAEYTIVNDANNLWNYDRATNVWTNSRDTGSSTKLTINVTSAGVVAMEYRMNGVDTNTSGHYAWNLSTLYVTLKQNGISNTIIAKHGETMREYQALEFDLKAGDQIIFNYDRAASNGKEDNVYLRGLRVQEQKLGVKLTAKEGGQVSFGGKTATSFNETVVDGTPVSFSAIPDSGYLFKYWTDESGEVVSRDPDVNIPLFMSAVNYTAHFFPAAQDLTIAAQTGWEQSADGTTYSLNSESLRKTTRLTMEFSGEGDITFDYAFFILDWSRDVYLYLDGQQVENFSNYSNSMSASATELTWHSFTYTVTGEGYHIFEVEYQGSNYYDGQDTFEIKGIQIQDTIDIPKETIEIDLRYNENFGTVFIDGVPYAPGKQQVAKGEKMEFSATAKTSVPSSVDPSQTTAVGWLGFFTEEANVVNSNYEHGMIWPDPSSCNMTFITDETGAQVATGNGSFQMTGNIIEARFQELAPAPEVSVQTQTDGNVNAEQLIQNGDKIVLPYGSVNHASILVRGYDAVKENYIVKINNEVTECTFVEDAGRSFFQLKDISADTTVAISYQADGYYESPSVTLHFAMQEAGTLAENLLVDGATDIAVENDPYVPWVFSGAYTTAEGYAYMASNSGALGYYGKSVASLKFTVTGAGVLDFDFKIHEGSEWLIGQEQPLSTTDAIKSLSPTKDENGEIVWGINGVAETAGNIIARGSSSAKDISNGNLMYWFKGTAYEGGKSTYMRDDGWAHVSIPVGVEGETKDYYISYYRDDDGYYSTTPFYDGDYALIRNVGFYKGDATVNYEMVKAEGGSVTATSGEQTVASGAQLAIGSRVKFTATVNEGYEFYGWVNANDQLLSKDTVYSCSATVNDFYIKAVVEKTGTYYLRNGGKFYASPQEAFAGAVAGDKLIVLRDGLVISENLELPAGVSLILPVNEKGDYYELGTTANATSRVSWATDALITRLKTTRSRWQKTPRLP